MTISDHLVGTTLSSDTTVVSALADGNTPTHIELCLISYDGTTKIVMDNHILQSISGVTKSLKLDFTELNKELARCNLEITEIGKGAFEGSDIEHITIPETVVKISDEAFMKCSKLTSVTLPQGISEIGKLAFFMSSIESINIPNGVTAIRSGAFAQCHRLASVTLPQGITEIERLAFVGSEIESINIPNRVTTISYMAFAQCDSLTSVTLPPGITEIGEYAFADCPMLTSVTPLPSNEKIGKNAFRGTGIRV